MIDTDICHLSHSSIQECYSTYLPVYFNAAMEPRSTNMTSKLTIVSAVVVGSVVGSIVFVIIVAVAVALCLMYFFRSKIWRYSVCVQVYCACMKLYII